MRVRLVLVAAVGTLVMASTALAAAPLSRWHQCPNSIYSSTQVVLTYKLSCRDALSVAKHGVRRSRGAWFTRTGGFRCTRQPNAENVVWLYTCLRHNGQQGFFDNVPK
ncbi:MAG TPA: hypothetical protein VIJ76_07080 [Galbitalea sp.]